MSVKYAWLLGLYFDDGAPPGLSITFLLLQVGWFLVGLFLYSFVWRV